MIIKVGGYKIINFYAPQAVEGKDEGNTKKTKNREEWEELEMNIGDGEEENIIVCMDANARLEWKKGINERR